MRSSSNEFFVFPFFKMHFKASKRKNPGSGHSMAHAANENDEEKDRRVCVFFSPSSEQTIWGEMRAQVYLCVLLSQHVPARTEMGKKDRPLSFPSGSGGMSCAVHCVCVCARPCKPICLWVRLLSSCFVACKTLVTHTQTHDDA